MQKYRFGEFELDLDAKQLRLRGAPVPLERRPLDLLILLVTQRDRLLEREELITALWPPRVIIDFDSGLNTLVRKVRNALGDSSDDPRFIETVQGRGYRFVSPVTPVTQPEPHLEPPSTSSPEARFESPVRPRPGWRVVAAGLLIVSATAAALVAWRGDPGVEVTRIAVLPFENLTGDESLGYLAAGLAEDTSTSLAGIDLANLRVIGGVSARALADAALPRIGRELGVDFLVLSSLRAEQSRIRVTSRLLRVSDGEQIWSAAFDRELTNVLGLQRELSIAIAEQIRQRLSPTVAAAIDRRQTQNPVAYERYLKGRYEWTRLSPASNRRAVEYYEQAVAVDPDYALAWAGIAHTLVTSLVTTDADPVATIERARQALAQAMRLGPDLAEVQYAKGYFHNFVEWDLPTARAAAVEAVTLDPNSTISYILLGIVLSQLDEHAEALVAMRRARELDPLFSQTFAISSMVARDAGELDSALELARQAVAMNPEGFVGHLHLGNAQLALGEPEAALEAFSSAARLSGGNSIAVSSRAHVLVELGREDEARRLLAELTSRAVHRHVPPYTFAVIHAALGDTDAALGWLERALDERDMHVLGFHRDRRLQSLHGDPRFEALIRRSGFMPGAQRPAAPQG